MVKMAGAKPVFIPLRYVSSFLKIVYYMKLLYLIQFDENLTGDAFLCSVSKYSIVQK